jgi:hypothetical protein
MHKLRKAHAQRPLTLEESESEEQHKGEKKNCRHCDKGNNLNYENTYRHVEGNEYRNKNRDSPYKRSLKLNTKIMLLQ